MGLLVDGQWQDKWYETKESGGRFQREDAGFRNWVTVDGSAGPTGIEGFKAEPDRYHLYVSLACPWAHRTLIYRKLKGPANQQMFRAAIISSPACSDESSVISTSSSIPCSAKSSSVTTPLLAITNAR